MAISRSNNGIPVPQHQINPSISLHGIHLVPRDRTLGNCSCEIAWSSPTSNSQTQPIIHYGNRLGEAAQALLLLSEPCIAGAAGGNVTEQVGCRLPPFQAMFPTPPRSPSRVRKLPDTRRPQSAPSQTDTESTEESENTHTEKRAHKRQRRSNVSWECGPDRPVSQQFLLNIAFWLDEVIEGMKPADSCELLEQLASGLRLWSGNGTPLSQQETEFLRARNAENAQGRFKHRIMRAKIIVGLACVYEHNIRGSTLKQYRLPHAAFGTSGQDLVYINMGKSQAQQLCRGFDVNRASKIFGMCQQDGRLPEIGQLNLGHGTYNQTAEADAIFPADIRKRLYDQFCCCYAQHDLPSHSVLVITDKDLLQQRQLRESGAVSTSDPRRRSDKQFPRTRLD